jgi:UDP-N-acetylglucosamine--N-acetylmuramyl-(pentapeptide) pyrophosphoryl-undecaprenol N-acetylglucosamine transferase
VFGGSQGARVFATLVPEAIGLLPQALRQRLNIVQQCRPEDLEAAKSRYEGMGLSPTLAAFFNNMGELLSNSHLVISRSGASTVTEECAVGRPAILIPYPFAMDDHQTANARQVEAVGGAWMFPEKTLTAQILAAKITELMETPVLLETAAAKALSLGRSDAAKRLADLVEDVGGLKAGAYHDPAAGVLSHHEPPATANWSTAFHRYRRHRHERRRRGHAQSRLQDPGFGRG